MAVGGALFSSGRGGGAGGSGSGKSSLVEFRAGKMEMGANNLVTADKRKGMVIIEQSDDQLMHFKWKDRTNGKIEDDLIIFPDDIEYKKVPQCTTGRVYVLKFKSSPMKMFFWMQEPKTDKDDEYCKKINDYLNNPPTPGSTSRSGGSAGGLENMDFSGLGDTDLQRMLSSLSQRQLMQIFGQRLGDDESMGSLASLLGATQSSGRQRSSNRASRESSTPSTPSVTTASLPASTTATATTTTSSTSNTTTTTASSQQSGIQISDLQNILSNIQVPGGAAGGGDNVAVDLAAGGITGEVMEPLLKNPDFVKRMKELLPTEHQNEDVKTEITGTVQSPQFQQALSLFSSAFQSGQLAPLIREFNLGDDAIAAATAGNMEAFVKALSKKEKKKPQDEPEEMALD